MIRPSENINLKLSVYDVLFDVRWVLDGSPGPTVAGYVKDDAFSSIRLYLVFFVIGAPFCS